MSTFIVDNGYFRPILSPMDPDEIKTFRKQKKLSQEKLGDLCGVTKATVSKWEKGQRNPSGSALIQLKRILHGDTMIVPLNDLEIRMLDESVRLGGFKSREDYLTESLKHMIQHGGFLEPDNVEPDINLGEIDHHTLPGISNNKVTHLHLVERNEEAPSITEDDTVHTLPLLGAIAAGSGITGDNLDEVAVSRYYPEDHFALRVMGDSMDNGSADAIPDGSLAIIRKMPESQPYAAKNRIYAWCLDDGQVLKKFTRRKVDGKTQGFLESLNPAYAAIPYEEGMKPQGEFIRVD